MFHVDKHSCSSVHWSKTVSEFAEPASWFKDERKISSRTEKSPDSKIIDDFLHES